MINKKKFVTAAVTMSLVMGVSGTAMAGTPSLYGVGIDGTKPETTVANTTPDKSATTDSTKAGTTGADYTITGGEWSNAVGGIHEEKNVTGNTITIKGGKFDWGCNIPNLSQYFNVSVAGGIGYEGSVSGNTVNIEGTVEVSNKYLEIDGGNNDGEGDVIGNTVNVLPGSGIGSDDVVIYITGGLSEDGKAEKNIVNITGGIIKSSYGEIVGGYVDAGTADSTDNAVYIGNASITGDVYGGIVYSGTGAATGNTVTISGGSIGGNILGAWAKGDANKNTVNISGGTIRGKVYGGISVSGTVSNNTVNISGTADMSNASLYGYSGTSGGGNTLNIAANWTGVEANGRTVKSIQNFESVNLNIPANATSGTTMLTVTNALSLSTIGNIGIYAHPGTNLNKNDVITLIKDSDSITYSSTGTSVNGSTDKLTDSNKTISNVNISGNDFLIFKANVTAEDNAIKAEITDHRLAEASKSPVETQVTGLSMLTTGGDIMAGDGMESATAAVRAEKGMEHKTGTANMYGAGASSIMTPFAVIGGNNMRVNSSSHVDVKSWNINVGFAKEVQNSNGTLLFGPVVEYGRGSYDSYVDTDNGTYHGYGNTSFMGLGFIAKQTNKDNFYYEGSLRVGRLSNDYSSTGGSYDKSTTYYGLHAGIGQVFKVNAQDSFDCYAKLFWTHQNGIDAQLGTAGILSMDAVNSFRSKLGFRYNHAFNAKNAMYAGLAWQDEFKGTANATLGGEATPAPSVKGNTGILELGWKNFAAKNLEVDFGLKAYTGVQRGAGINAKLNWKF